MVKRWSQAILAVGALLLVYWLGSCQGKSSAERTAAIEQAQAVLAAGEPYRDSIARLAQLASIAQDSIKDYKRRYAQRGALISQLDTALQRAAEARDSLQMGRVALHLVVQLRGQITTLQAENVQFVRMDSLHMAQARFAQQRIDSLEARLRGLLTVSDCHIAGLGFLPRCPSRTASFVLGAGVGVGLALLGRRI